MGRRTNLQRRVDWFLKRQEAIFKIGYLCKCAHSVEGHYYKAYDGQEGWCPCSNDECNCSNFNPMSNLDWIEYTQSFNE